ncbi:hypothetical protein HQ544_01720 [Candidatus Falkowbacteria bacterium]|nr:hypothetical protein [Candidatus Falkowbacteria bacterium]
MKEKIYISKVTKDVKNAIKDCLLNILYKKSDLIDFLRECGSTSNDMNGIEESLTKSNIIDIYYNNLEKRVDNGMMQFHALIRNIIDWSDFDSYWFQQGALAPEQAKNKIENLKKILGKKTEKEEERLKIKEREKDAEKKRDKNRTMEELCIEFYEMCKNEDGSQRRGYQLETFLKKLFGLSNINVFKPFKLQGEQIDGSIKFDGENYTFEARWQEVAMACNALYTFAYKIETNMLYPRGLFFSINGFSKDAVQRVTHGKSPQLLLFDAVDFISVLQERITLIKLLEEKIRYAQTRSRIYINANEILK